MGRRGNRPLEIRMADAQRATIEAAALAAGAGSTAEWGRDVLLREAEAVLLPVGKQRGSPSPSLERFK